MIDKMQKALIHFDGGCSPNPGNKYGSFAIIFDGVFQLSKHRFDLGFGTNNEAEFEALLESLKVAQAACVKASIAMSEVALSIFTDNTIVRNWLQKFDHKSKQAKLDDLRREAMRLRAVRCLDLLNPFGAWEIAWNSRDVNVELFGH